jgi:hypothetical protein
MDEHTHFECRAFMCVPFALKSDRRDVLSGATLRGPRLPEGARYPGNGSWTMRRLRLMAFLAICLVVPLLVIKPGSAGATSPTKPAAPVDVIAQATPSANAWAWGDGSNG